MTNFEKVKEFMTTFGQEVKNNAEFPNDKIVELRKKLWVYIKELNKSGVTVLLTTHYLHEAEELCDYISIINKGKIVISETRNNLLDLVKKKTVNFILEN